MTAKTYDAILRAYTGYTLRTLMREDAYHLMQLIAILDEKCGEARDQ